jgi:succinate-semialdehyde dehydrogenase / glutarate-semialdehyde dehydrogenase
LENSRQRIEVSNTILIDGSWSKREGVHKNINPASGETISLQAVAKKDDVEAAIDSASAALVDWQESRPYERYEILDRVANLLLERAAKIGEVLSLESGKLLQEAIGEVRLSADYFSWFAECARRLEELIAVDGRPNGPQMVLQKPAGVVASLTPWNFPVSIQARKLAPALAAGCTIVARSSEEAPDSVVELFKCLLDAGLPDGVANYLTGPAKAIVDPIVSDPRVRVVSFTGSTRVGKMLYEQSAPTMKRLALELGGAAPFIVFEDADLEHTLEQAMLAKFRNCGQSCVAANCFYVEDGIYEDFVAGLAGRVASLRLGDPLLNETTLGPLINSSARRSMEDIRNRAQEEGFELTVSAPELPTRSGLSPDSFFAPTLLANLAFETIDPNFLHEEIFGPVALVVGFSDVEKLLNHLSQSSLGLAGYVFSQDVGRATQIAASLQVGIAGVNEGLATAVNVPMGGVKESGLGREGGHLGLEEFLDHQYLAMRDRPISALLSWRRPR